MPPQFPSAGYKNLPRSEFPLKEKGVGMMSLHDCYNTRKVPQRRGLHTQVFLFPSSPLWASSPLDGTIKNQGMLTPVTVRHANPLEIPLQKHKCVLPILDTHPARLRTNTSQFCLLAWKIITHKIMVALITPGKIHPRDWRHHLKS